MGTSVFGMTVDRVCRIRARTLGDDLGFPLDAEGFLDPSAVPDESVDALVPGALVSTTVAAKAGALVLLGEPGIGKTTEFRRLGEHSNVTTAGPAGAAQFLEVNAADITDTASFREELGSHLQALPPRQSEAPAWADSRSRSIAGLTSPDLVIVIDQIDESPFIRHLARRLGGALDGRDTSHLRLVLGCRTADYPPDLTDVLRWHCGDCTLADLAPLTREQAVRLASSAARIDGERLVAAAVNAGAGVLANVPLTLGLLVRTFRKTGSLDASATTLFAQGVAELLDEHEDVRRVVNDGSTVEQRDAIASRIAARLVLSDQRTIWCGPVNGGSEQDLRAESLAGGDESSASGSFPATKKVISATLATGIFTGRGSQRLGFRHGSFAAYLTARYLIAHEIPQAQLERLFLVAGSDASRSVPTQLREAAAWLITLAPDRGSWLVHADPESLVAHSPIVDSPEVRKLLVDALVHRAAEIELGDMPWSRARRDLTHPGLGGQLLAALGDTGGSEAEDWASRARVRLAVRLARESGTPELASPLLDLAENDAWSPHIRQLAAMTAFETAPDQSVTRLADLLDRLADVTYATSLDPDDELRGALLDMLWPRHVPIESVLPHLRPRRNRNLFGAYQRFLLEFPHNFSEQDVPTVLSWALQASATEARLESPSSSDDVQQREEDLPFERPLGQADADLIEGIADRALTGDRASDRIRDVAKLIWPRLDRFDRVPLPAPIDLEDDVGQEPPAARSLRRALARSLVEQSVTDRDFDHGDVWKIVEPWERSPNIGLGAGRAAVGKDLQRADRDRLLTAEDFVWLYETAGEAAAAGNDVLADALAQVCAYLFRLSDSPAGDLVYANQYHPIWPHVAWLFEPVALDSDHARELREALGRRKARRDEPSWAEHDQFVAKLNHWLVDAAGGDGDAFWRLAWNLQFEPTTGRGKLRLDDDILSFPGIAALGPDHLDAMLRAATQFISHEHDHAGEWLGTDRYDRRGWAGYLALALLGRQGRLTDVPEEAWASWVGALIWFHSVPANAGDRDLKARLLPQAVKHAAPELAAAVAAYVRGELTHQGLASEVELLQPAWHAELADTWAALLAELTEAITRPGTSAPSTGPDRIEVPAEPPNDASQNQSEAPSAINLSTEESRAHAMRIWETMIDGLFRANDDRAIELARATLARATTDERYRSLAAKAARTLLSASTDLLAEVLETVSMDTELSREVARECATAVGMFDFPANMDEDQLADLYRWLSKAFPPETDVHLEGVHFVSAEQQTRDWRDRTLQRISARETTDAVRVLAKLNQEYPDRLVIASNLINARKGMAASTWTPPRPDDLRALFEDSRRRLVRSESELADLLIDVLKMIEADLPSHGELLWDRLPKRVLPKDNGLSEAWLPKGEAAVSAYIRHELSNRLERRGLAVNREVLVKPTDASGAGDRTDVQVEATMLHRDIDGPIPDRVAVVIEVKGPWNRDLITAQREQLAVRYLPESTTTTGIYLVSWYPLEQWTDYRDHHRRRATAARERDRLVSDLDARAKHILDDLAMNVTPLVLTIPRPFRSTSARTGTRR